MRVTHTDGSEADVYYGLPEGGTGEVLVFWIKKPLWMREKVSEWSFQK